MHVSNCATSGIHISTELSAYIGVYEEDSDRGLVVYVSDRHLVT